jgi:hypothetical protein
MVMAQFVFAYRAPQNYTVGSTDARAAWSDWFAAMGAQVTDIGKPVIETSVLGQVGAGTQLGGYSIVTADDLEAAVALAKGCPFIGGGGGVEVGVLGELG